MKKGIVLFVVFLLCLAPNLYAQKFFIAEKYEFMGEPDQYGFSTLLRLYMEKYHYVAEVVPTTDQHTVMRKLTPNDYALQVQRKSNMFMTRITIDIVNYNGEVVLSSPEGNSREKEFRYANIESLRMAMDNFMDLKNHTFLYKELEKSNSDIKVQPSTTAKEVEDMPAVINADDVSLQAQTLSESSIGLFKKKATSPEMVLYKTSSRDCFLVEVNGKITGVLLYQNQKWFWEYYENNRLISREQFIKGL